MSTSTELPGHPLARIDWDYVEFYVGNAKQAAHYYMSAFGFDQIAYAGPETGVKGSSQLSAPAKRFAFRAHGESPARRRDRPTRAAARRRNQRRRDFGRRRRGGIRDGAAGGASPLQAPATSEDRDGRIVQAKIAAYGDTVHSFVQRDGYGGIFMPGFTEARKCLPSAQKPGLLFVDHCVGNVGWGEMDTWGDFYARVFGFSQLVSFDDKDISTEYTALRSKVMTDARHRVKFPINEPAQGKKKSQIEEYLDFYRGAGVQHMAIRTDDIAATIRALRANGVEFLDTPDSYYEMLEERVGRIDEATELLREQRILVDRDDLGYMLQIFTKPLQDRPTVFFEIIQRKGSLSFGKGNFKALFVSIEREQEKRGTL